MEKNKRTNKENQTSDRHGRPPFSVVPVSRTHQVSAHTHTRKQAPQRLSESWNYRQPTPSLHPLTSLHLPLTSGHGSDIDVAHVDSGTWKEPERNCRLDSMFPVFNLLLLFWGGAEEVSSPGSCFVLSFSRFTRCRRWVSLLLLLLF